MKTLKNSLLLYILALSTSYAEVIDSTSSKWTGNTWVPNQLNLAHLPYQAGIFPCLTQGTGQVALPAEAFVLRLGLLQTNQAPETIAQVWGTVAGSTDVCIATLKYTGKNYVWECPVSTTADSLFDADQTVILQAPPTHSNQWVILDTIINPNAYQQMFGWSTSNLSPHDPALPLKGSMVLGRQLSPAEWHLHQLKILPLKHNFIGRIELLPAGSQANTTPVNIYRQ